MGVSFGKPKIADMTFQVFGRALHPDWFSAREFFRLTHNDWEADIRIIEGGHSVVFRAGHARLTEVLAGPETALPEPGLLFHSPIRHERSKVLQPSGGLEYQTCFEVERLDPEVFTHLCDEIALDASRSGLFHRFAVTNRMVPAAITHIKIDSRIRGLSIHTFHTFPEEHAIVRSQSLFETRAALPSP